MEAELISTLVSSGQRAQSPAAGLMSAQEGKNSVAQDEHLGAKAERNLPSEAAKAQTAEEIESLVERLNTKTLTNSHTLRFSIDEEHGKAIISVVDRDTEEVIRQIPSETALQIADAFEEVSAGQLLSAQA